MVFAEDVEQLLIREAVVSILFVDLILLNIRVIRFGYFFRLFCAKVLSLFLVEVWDRGVFPRSAPGYFRLESDEVPCGFDIIKLILCFIIVHICW